MSRKKWNKKKRLIKQARSKIRRRPAARRAPLVHKPGPLPPALPAWATVWLAHVRDLKFPVVWAWRGCALAGMSAWLLLALVPAWEFLVATPPDKLWRAYTGAIYGFRQTHRGWNFLLGNGLELPYADGLKMSLEERLDQADPETVLSQTYVCGETPVPAAPGVEPGRFRNYELFKAAYGATPDEVKKSLVVVDFLGLGVVFNERNGAAQALREAGAEIQADPEARAYVMRVAGSRLQSLRGSRLRVSPNISSWNWRCIAGTQRLSPHSFGIAVDINKPHPTQPSYWRWVSPRRFPRGFEDVKNLENVSWRVIGIFEKHGFIWGGKWHHFDTMHFEYRPEFLAASRPSQATAGQRPNPRGL